MSWMTIAGSTKVLHTITKRREWIMNAGAGPRRMRTRSYTNRAMIFAITTGIAAPHPSRAGTWMGVTPRPGDISRPRWITLKFHSMQTWKYPDPMAVDASTQMNLSREDAEMLVVGLLASITEFDQQEAVDAVIAAGAAGTAE